MHLHSFLSQFWPNTLSGLAQGAVIALFALGYTLVYGVLRLINFAHSEVFMIGTFAAIGVWGAFGYDENATLPSIGMLILLMLLAFAGAMAASGAAAVMVELVAYRPLRRRNAPPLAFLITAIGVSLVLQEVVGVLFTHRNQVGIPVLISPKPLFHVSNAPVNATELLIIGLALAMMFVLDRFINRTRHGRGIRAVAQNPESAALMGVNKNRVISLVFLLGGLMAGIAAVMYDMKIGNARYDDGFFLGLEAFTAAVLGGIGNLRGALVGGLTLGVVEYWGGEIFGSNYRLVVAFFVLIIILMFRPTGILGESLGRARA